MNRKLINLFASAVIALGALALWDVPEAMATIGEGCKYADCMQYCTMSHSFDYCHTLCNKDCDAE